MTLWSLPPLHRRHWAYRRTKPTSCFDCAPTHATHTPFRGLHRLSSRLPPAARYHNTLAHFAQPPCHRARRIVLAAEDQERFPPRCECRGPCRNRAWMGEGSVDGTEKACGWSLGSSKRIDFPELISTPACTACLRLGSRRERPTRGHLNSWQSRSSTTHLPSCSIPTRDHQRVYIADPSWTRRNEDRHRRDAGGRMVFRGEVGWGSWRHACLVLTNGGLQGL